MKIEINKKWKEEIENKIEETNKLINEMFEEYVKSCEAGLRGRIAFYEKEVQYLRGQLTAIELIEEGCFVEGISEGGKAYV